MTTQAAAPPGIRDLLLESRPGSWPATALPFLVAAFDVTRAIDLALIIGTLAFLLPYNLLRHAAPRLFDPDADAPPGTAAALVGRATPITRRVLVAIVVTCAPFLVVLTWLAGPAAGIGLLLAAAVPVAAAVPPVQARYRAVADPVAFALELVLPAVCGFLVAGLPPGDLPWLVLGGLFAWGIATDVLRAVRDAEHDRARGLASVATVLGRRRAAVVALGGYALAVLATLTVVAPWGFIAALVSAPFLLLPLMVVARDDASQARRAWRNLRQLTLLVGAGLGLVLLRAWDITTYGPWDLALWSATIAATWMLVNVVLIRITTRRRAPATHAGDPPPPALTVVVACRNDAARLPACLEALAGQHYRGVLSVLVVDDGSTDDSFAVAAAFLEPFADRGRLVAAPAAPEDWTHAAWALSTGVGEAASELVLLLDPATTLERDGARRLVRELEATDAALVSGATRYAMPSLGERATVPGYPMLLFGFLPAWLSALRGGRPAGLALSYGPLQLVRRSAYLETGGHAAVPGSRRKAIDLARTFARAGLRVHATHATGLGATRRHETARGVLASWSRSLPDATGGSIATALLVLAAEACAWVLPFALPFVAGALAPDRLAASFTPLGILFAARIVLALTQREPLVTVALHPVTAIATLAAQVVAFGPLVTGRGPAADPGAGAGGNDMPDRLAG